MSGRIKFITVAFAWILAASCVVAAQKNPRSRIEGPVASLSTGLSVRFLTITNLPISEPPVSSMAGVDESSPPMNVGLTFGAVSSMVSVDDSGVIHRVLIDKRGGRYFGYDLAIEPVAESKQFKLSIKPLTLEFERHLQQDPEYRRHTGNSPTPLVAVSLPRYPEPQLVEDGDLMKVELLTNEKTGTKILDLIHLIVPPTASSALSSQKPAQDLTLEDVEMNMSDFQLLVDGEQVAASEGGGAAGALLWFYTPDAGRVIFSLLPRPGYDFQKAAVLEDNKISFSLEGHRYEWISSRPVLTSSGRWNLWVLRDRDFRPSGIFAEAAAKASADQGSASNPGQTRKAQGLQTATRRLFLMIGAADAPAYLFQPN